ncbi:hypothetical protein [Pseudomonas sp. NPDC089401]|uniref:hypothetical protein n=1 Tax=Pseudomonas sp. NPDC089401 TaxID=3364462 RepID=UPI003813D207
MLLPENNKTALPLNNNKPPLPMAAIERTCVMKHALPVIFRFTLIPGVNAQVAP